MTVLKSGDKLRNVQQIQATEQAFAAILADGSVVTWGESDSGGDSSAVQDQLRNVQQIQATVRVFAAILADGSVVTWGNHDHDDGGIYGMISSRVRDKLRNVQQIKAALIRICCDLGRWICGHMGQSHGWW